MTSLFLKKILLCAAVFGLASVASASPARVIRPTDPAIRYVGRFDFDDPAGPRCAWSASRLEFRVEASRVSVRLKESNRSLWQVFVDGEPGAVISSRGPEGLHLAWEGSGRETRTIALVKRTEFNTGSTQILGIELDDGGRLLPPETPRKPARTIEVIGDSISCGYGNEAASKEERFSAETENAAATYGALAAAGLGADYVCVAWSGKKLWPDNSILDYYEHVLPSSAAARWDFKRITPDVVVVNLGTNDFARENPDEDGWVAAARGLVERIRSNYPGVPVVFCVGPMLSDYPAARKPRTHVLRYIERVVKETDKPAARVAMVDFGVQQQSDGIGADWHPSVATHRKMADKLTPVLRELTGW